MLVVVVLFALLLYSCVSPTNIDVHRVLSPDGQLAFVEHVESGGGSAGWVFTELWIEGTGDKAEITAFSHAYPPTAVRWLSNSEVIFCSPNAEPQTPSRSRVKVGSVYREVTVAMDCDQLEGKARG